MALRRNVLWNLMGNGLPLVAAALAFPLLNSRMGTERFGIVTLLWTMVGYLSLFDLGLGRALTQIMAKNRGLGQLDQNLGVLRTGVAFTLWAGVAGGMLLVFVAGPLAAKWLRISPIYQSDVRTALFLTALAVPLTTVSAAIRGALEGAERFLEVNVARVFLGVSSFLLPVVMILAFRPTLLVVAVSLLLSRVLTLIIFWRSLRRAYPAYRWGVRPDLTHGKTLVGFGLWMTISNIISPVLVYSDRFIISGTLGAGLVAFYTVPFEIMVRLQILPGAIGSTLFPRLSAQFQTDPMSARKLVRRAVLITLGIMLVLIAAVLGLYQPVVSRWMDPGFASRSFPIALALGCGSLVNGVSNVIYTAVQAKGGARPTGTLHLIEMVIYLPLLIVVVHGFGIQGAAWIWVFRVCLDCLLLTWVYRRATPSLSTAAVPETT